MSFAQRGRPDGDLFAISDEVAQALQEDRPVVALESAALARGFPAGMAMDVEERIENAVRDQSAVPALLYLRDKRIHVGGTREDMAALAGNRHLGRVSRGTMIGMLNASGYSATTVSASMMICGMIGIPILAVGGIGGVHTGAFYPLDNARTVSLDVSPDLEELARTPVAVVASGAKSFLDLPATMQWLETRGVPVVTLGSQKIPGYFSSDSSENSPIVANDLEDGARLLRLHIALAPGTGLLFCVPVPPEAAIPANEIERASRIAHPETAAKGIVGGEVTAAILDVLARETNNRTLDAQAAMSVRNATVAAALANRLVEMQSK